MPDEYKSIYLYVPKNTALNAKHANMSFIFFYLYFKGDMIMVWMLTIRPLW